MVGTATATAWGIWVLDTTTGERRQLTAGPDQFEPDWRPDGASILFTNITSSGNTIASAELAVVAPDGTGMRPIIRLSGGVGTLGNPTWSPDGTRIAFTVNYGYSGGELYVANADGTGARRLLAHDGWDDIDPRWSPDGRYIAFAAGVNQLGTALHDIWLVDLTTGLVGTVARHPTWELRRPAWSPDGRWLVFTARYQDNPPRWSMYSVPAVGGDVTGPIASGVEPDWASGALGGFPTPMPGATAPFPTPPAPPPFPTNPPPEPTLPGATPTYPAPPTFPAGTPPPEATPTLGPPTTPTKDVPPTVAPTLPYVRGRVFLAITVNGWDVRLGREGQ
jgi:Tol biopolymer transport system component